MRSRILGARRPRASPAAEVGPVAAATSRSAAKRSATAFIATTLIATALSGCAFSDGSGSTVTQARNTLYSTLDELQEVLGGEWTNEDDPTSRGCTIPLWVDGELYPGLRTATAPADPAAAIADVMRAWTTAGMEPTKTVVGTTTELQVRDVAGQLIIVRVSSKGMTLQGESECRPRE
jgi:hypothetical protein